MRNFGTDRGGGGFSEATINAVWQKGRPIENFSPNEWRWDSFGSPMYRASYGTTGQDGWEIDHIYPVAAGGGDQLSNLQPLQWQNNRKKGDKIL